MPVARIFTGDDGKSHLEELELRYEMVGHTDRTAMQSATGIQFRRASPGTFHDFHVAPRRQYVITLEGQAEMSFGDGSKRIFNAGDVELADDLTGQGHTPRVVGDKANVSIAIPLVDRSGFPKLGNSVVSVSAAGEAELLQLPANEIY